MGTASEPFSPPNPCRTPGPDDLTFVENERNLRLLANCRAAAVVTPASLAERIFKLNQRGMDVRSQLFKSETQR